MFRKREIPFRTLRSHSVLRIRQNTHYFGELRYNKLAVTRALKNKMADKNTAKKEEIMQSSSSELQGF